MQTRYTSADQWAEAKDGVIPAPYALEEGEQIIDRSSSTTSTAPTSV